jgi:hypothetical protein
MPIEEALLLWRTEQDAVPPVDKFPLGVAAKCLE